MYARIGIIHFGIIVLALFASTAPLRVSAQTEALGTVEHIQVHSPAIEGNLQGNSAERDVFVYLPPSYATSPDRRYPVVYQLHGWLPGGEQWSGMIDLEGSTNRSLAAGASQEMIIVVPDSLSIHGGSMYSPSPTTGDFEAFIARDLVADIDARYRTLARRESRGLSGHSMGGYGTWRIAMKYPEVWSSFYAMSSCCLGAYSSGGGMAEAAKIRTLEQAAEAGIGTRVQLTLAAAWSPNPGKPPLYFDFPINENGELNPLILARWNANVPLRMIHRHIAALRTFDAIGIEVGLQDGLIGVNRQISDVLNAYDIGHIYETYEGNHTNRVAERYETRVLPFFSERLSFE